MTTYKYRSKYERTSWICNADVDEIKYEINQYIYQLNKRNYLLKKATKSISIPLLEIVALCQSGLMDGSAKPWFAGSNPAGASNLL